MTDAVKGLDGAMRAFADVVLKNAPKAPTIAMGPVVWGIDAGSDTKHWYFMVGAADKNGRFHVDQFKIASDERELAEQCRGILMMEFVTRRPAVMHDFDDELTLARFCESMWPCAKTKRILASMESDRAPRGNPHKESHE